MENHISNQDPINRNYKSTHTKIRSSKKQHPLSHIKHNHHGDVSGDNKSHWKCRKNAIRETQDEYDLKMENSRIINRIIFPKRDKIILNSIRDLYQFKKFKSNKENRYQNFRKTQSLHSRKRSDKDCLMSKENKKNSKYLQEYRIELENHRMAQRIINVRPAIQSSASTRPKNRKKVVNKGVRSLMNTKFQRPETKSQNEPLSMVDKNVKTYYGYGPTIIEISSISILCLPQLKDDDLISLELLPISYVNSKTIFNPTQSISKNYLTHGIEYQRLRQTKIRFAVRIKNIGQYVPVRIWLYKGIQSVQIGTFDIQLNRYTIGNDQMSSLRPKNGVSGSYCGRLRKTKFSESENSVQMKYKIYKRKFG